MYQSGFRPGHSCVTALQKVSEDLRKVIDDSQIAILVLLDHSKAFDSVDHDTLCLKLTKFFNFSRQSTQLISSYLSNRSQFVTLGTEQSKSIYVHRGVPQGSILGPLLYSMYSNDLPSCVVNCNIHMYADDVQLYLGFKKSDLVNNINLINDDLARIINWASANGLTLNASKSKCLIVSKSTFQLPEYISLNIENSPLEIVTKSKNLGVIFNNRLTWRDHIVSAIGNTSSALRNLYVSQKYTPIKIRLLLAKTYLVPKLLYACEIFSSCTSDMFRKLNATFNNITRYIFGLKRRDHVSNYAKSIYGVTFENLLGIRQLISLHRIIYHAKPSYLYNYLRFARSSRGCQLIQIRHEKSLSEKFFFISAIRLWNQLPSRIQIISNDTQFKSNIFNFFQ